jgi:hypothetical protein
MQPSVILQLTLLLTVANGAPVIAKNVLGSRWDRPVDGGIRFNDGRPLFGSSKTIRGLLASVVATALCAPLIGLGVGTGLTIGVSAMAGDLASSFIKRRLDVPPSSRMTGVDQIPESLVPLLVCRKALALDLTDIIAVVALFFVGEVLLSRLLYRFRLRDRPY